MVLAHRGDPVSTALVRRWQEADARLLTARDLSHPGWVVTEPPGRGSVVVAGERMPCHRVRGVLVRAEAIGPSDLPWIAREDRAYCAAEVTAFLTWWLTGLPVPVVNRPTPRSLVGPGWPPPAWHLLAHRLGIRTTGVRWRASEADHGQAGDVADRAVEVITVVARRSVGEADPLLARQAVGLAAAAGLASLAVSFDVGCDPPALIGAQPLVDVSEPRVADALLDVLLGADAGRGPG